MLILAFLISGFVYNLFFFQEYIWGRFYGNPAKVARASVDYVIADKNIKGVITYNDIGAYELRLSGKYLSRFYTAESRDYTAKLSAYQGYYLIVDFPEIDKKGRYWPLINKCPLAKTFQDKKVIAYIFDCSKIGLKQ
jgi:hypothetical protein